MKIAMMVRGYITAPRPSDIVYAPIDLAVSIAEGLVARGNEVDFYGPKGTNMKSGIKTRNLRPLIRNQAEFQELISKPDLLAHYMTNLWDGYLAHEMFERARKGEYDLLHFDHPEVALLLSYLYPEVPVAYTLHDPIYAWYQEIFKMYDSSNQFFISISNNQRRDAPNLRYVSTVHHGINPKLFPYSKDNDGYLLYIGRVVPEKGVHKAIRVAEMTNNKLLIIGPTYPDKQQYFERYIRPHLNSKIQYLDYIKNDELWRYYQGAKAFLTPIQWEEPFGLTMIEAMSCGTPVVAFRRGSAPEIVVDGKTGFLVKTTAQMAAAVNKIETIKRIDCHRHVEKNFSIDNMVSGYEQAFGQIIRDFKPKR